jgi:hypothetical protein
MWRHRRFWTITLTILVLATLGKQFSNDWYSYTHKGPMQGISAAKNEGLYITKFKIDPPKLEHDEMTFEFGEAWVEERYEQRNILVWYSDMKRADWDFFCLQPKTDCYQKGVLIDLTPEFFPPLDSESGDKSDYFSEVGDLWYQRVPTDLQKVKVTVTAKFHDSGKTITVGTAELTRE